MKPNKYIGGIETQGSLFEVLKLIRCKETNNLFQTEEENFLKQLNDKEKSNKIYKR